MYNNLKAIENTNRILESKFNNLQRSYDISYSEHLENNIQEQLKIAESLLQQNTNKDLHNFIKDFNLLEQEDIYKIFNFYELKNVSIVSNDYIEYNLGISDNESKNLLLTCSFYLSDYAIFRISMSLNDIIQGLKINNTLHKILPHFVITYGYKMGGPTYFQKQFPNDILAVTSHNKNDYLYIYRENVDAVYFRDIVSKLSTIQFLNLWYQLLFLLQITQQESYFVYNDDLYNNLLVENLQNEIVLPYTINLKTKQLLRINKYELVTQDIENYNSYRDIYNFLGRLSVKVINIDNKKLIPLCRNFMKFFNKIDSLEDIIERQYKNSPVIFNYPDTKETKDIQSFNNFIDYCINLYEINDTKQRYIKDDLKLIKWQNLYDLYEVINNHSDKKLIKYYRKRAQLAKQYIDKIVVCTQLDHVYLYADLYYKLLAIKKLPKDLIAFLNYKDELLFLINNTLKLENQCPFEELKQVLNYTYLTNQND